MFEIYLTRKPANLEIFKQEVIHDFEKRSTGILHIGAHLGQEASRYSELKKRVIWVEAIPEIYEGLLTNIMKFENQKAVCALIGDENLINKTFYLSSNSKESSSLFNFARMNGYPDLKMTESIILRMRTLDEIFSENEICNYSHWVIDVQGAEMNVINGSLKLLKYCKSLLIEVSTRDVYENGTRYYDLLKLLENQGFHPLWAPSVNSHEDVLFLRF